MTMAGRRRVLRGIGWCALAPLGGFSLAVPGRAARAISVPFGRQFRLTRRLERELMDGKFITVVREFAIRFEPAATGSAITGHQSAVEVDAPESLAPLVAVERDRKADGFFPVQLDGDGLIVGMNAVPHQTYPRAFETARQIFARLPEGDPRKVDARRFLADLSARAAEAVSAVAADLFFPVPGAHTEVRELPAAAGAQGTIEVSVSATTYVGSGLLEMSERRVVTRLGDSSRLSLERWQMAEI